MCILIRGLFGAGGAGVDLITVAGGIIMAVVIVTGIEN
jgi:hypothetical protein